MWVCQNEQITNDNYQNISKGGLIIVQGEYNQACTIIQPTLAYILVAEIKDEGVLTHHHHSSPAKSGSHAGSLVGVCFMRSSTEAGTYFLSTTRRNMYSSNHSSVMMR